MNDIAWSTIAGVVRATSEIEPYFLPTREELNRAHAYTFAAGMPIERLNEWLERFDVESVKEIRSYDALYSLWLFMVRWSIEHANGESPSCPIGSSIYRQVQDSRKTLLTPPVSAL